MHFDSVSHQLTPPDEFEPAEPRERAERRLWSGLLVSLVIHALILSLQIGIPGLELPSLELPWKERRKPVEGIQVQLDLPAPNKQAAPAAPSVTMTELFKLPEPILPVPIAKADGGIVVLPRPSVVTAQEPNKRLASKTKSSAKKQASQSAPPVQKTVLPPPEAPVRIITQDQTKNEDFLVPLTSEEELERQRSDKKEQKRQAEPIPADAVIDKDAEAQLQEEKRKAELAAKRLQEEQQKKEQEQQRLAEQKRQEELRSQQLLAKAAEEQQQRLAKMLDEKSQKAVDITPLETVRDSNEQRQIAKQKAAQALAKREQEQALEEALQEAKRKELLAQETLKQEEQRRQAEQQRQKQLALEQEQQRQAALAKQREREEQERVAKQQALALAEKKAQEQKQLEQQLLEKRIAEQKLAEQKILEQKLAEQKLAEQKLAEQKAAEQRLAEQKAAEQRAAEQKLAEQRAAEQKAAEQRLAAKLAADKAAADAAAKANAERLLAQSGTGNNLNGGESAGSRNPNGNANPNGTGNGAGNAQIKNGQAANLANAAPTDLASRLRDQVRQGDVLKSRLPSTRGVDESQRARRRSFLGAYDKEVPLRMYIDSVRLKWERNGNLIYEKRSIGNTEFNLELMVIIKNDGSVEEVSILKSSGNRAHDERARNIALTNGPYAAFPPALAAKYDVIEVKHVWIFGDRLRILDDLPQF
ncbi:hypothetical protein RF679_11830 [Undibacterium cyanobacteriorum]|uniref:TonB C-terminal domain-containing protein n=1 Tax=Undibacterium cyanobacteriorum TaxID=3073561 RepID=A0ABY9REG6_9BURK|nr:hypothetical protein [Undibacterium sp. 20NA77.5]WMW79336.1 hypothetical protein RF679_11830 [Undibacterium sp. 20NA77.5]